MENSPWEKYNQYIPHIPHISLSCYYLMGLCRHNRILFQLTTIYAFSVNHHSHVCEFVLLRGTFCHKIC